LQTSAVYSVIYFFATRCSQKVTWRRWWWRRWWDGWISETKSL